MNIFLDMEKWPLSDRHKSRLRELDPCRLAKPVVDMLNQLFKNQPTTLRETEFIGYVTLCVAYSILALCDKMKADGIWPDTPANIDAHSIPPCEDAQTPTHKLPPFPL
jgi:hypothetical protein